VQCRGQYLDFMIRWGTGEEMLVSPCQAGCLNQRVLNFGLIGDELEVIWIFYLLPT
jgi:hypothetical protein